MPLLALLLLLVAVILPTPTAAAAHVVSVDPGAGRVGGAVEVSGGAYQRLSQLDIYFSDDKARVGDEINDLNAYKMVAQGVEVNTGKGFSTCFYVPAEVDTRDVDLGRHYVYVTYHNQDNIEAVADFEVTGFGAMSPCGGTSSAGYWQLGPGHIVAIIILLALILVVSFLLLIAAGFATFYLWKLQR